MEKKHFVIMLLCCLVPLAAIAAVTFFRIPLNNLLTFGLVLLCPVSHLLMMKFMMNGHEHGEQEHAHHGQTAATVMDAKANDPR